MQFNLHFSDTSDSGQSRGSEILILQAEKPTSDPILWGNGEEYAYNFRSSEGLKVTLSCTLFDQIILIKTVYWTKLVLHNYCTVQGKMSKKKEISNIPNFLRKVKKIVKYRVCSQNRKK